MIASVLPHLFFILLPLFGAVLLLGLYHQIRGITASILSILCILLVIPGFFLPSGGNWGDGSMTLIPRGQWNYSILFLIVINSTALLALLVAWREEAEHPRSTNYYAFLLLFIASMNFTVLANDFITFMIGWETILLSSSLLIAHWGKVDNCRVIARKYFIISQAASLCVMAALLLITNTTTANHFTAEVNSNNIPAPVVSWILILLTIGFFTKLAVFPLHIWLPDAHTAAAMPVTILLACAMLPLGVYGILRIGVGLLGVDSFRSLQTLFLAAGLLTKLIGAILAARTSEFKRVIAYSSISQAGIFLIGLGLCLPESFAAATFHVLIHAPIKALLFITIGEVIERSGHITVEAARIPIQTNRGVFAAFCLAAAALAGLPPLTGFSSEWFLASVGFQSEAFWVTLFLLLISLMTSIYLIRVLMNAFSSQPHHPISPSNRHNERVTPALVMAGVLILLQSVFAHPLYQWLLTYWRGG